MNHNNPTRELHTCIHNFIRHEYPSGLLTTMNCLLNNFIEHSDFDRSDSALIADVVSETIRINAFFVELSEKFESVGYEYREQCTVNNDGL